MRNFPLSLFTIVDENLDGADVANNPQVDGVALDWCGVIARGPRGLGGAAAQEDRAGQRIVADGGKRRSGERREAKFNSLRNGGGRVTSNSALSPRSRGTATCPDQPDSYVSMGWEKSPIHANSVTRPPGASV